MMICQRCHAQSDDGAVFCDVCGHELSSTPPAEWVPAPPALGAPRPTPSAPTAPVAPDATNAALPLRAAQGVSGSPAPFTVPDVVRLVITLRLTSGQRFTLRGKNDYTIGRTSSDQPQPDVDVATSQGADSGVSRAHVMLHVRANGVFVEDLESTNETVHNGYRLLPLQWYPLSDGDELKLGAVTLYLSFDYV